MLSPDSVIIQPTTLAHSLTCSRLIVFGPESLRNKNKKVQVTPASFFGAMVTVAEKVQCTHEGCE